MSTQSPEIVYEDESLLAVVKPYGMIVNNADTSRHEYTLQDWIEESIKNRRFKMELTASVLSQRGTARGESDFIKRAGIVHRLDKETSGLLLVGKNEKVFKNLQSQFKERSIEKTYAALCHGFIKGAGSVSVPIGRLPWNRMRFGVVPDGRTATTDFKPDSIYLDPDDKNLQLTLLSVFPKTGRTHQIRVHMQYLGHPIYSDSLYAGRKISARDRKRLARHFLHAQKISFTHPVTIERINIASDLPKDLQGFLDSLDKREA